MKVDGVLCVQECGPRDREAFALGASVDSLQPSFHICYGSSIKTPDHILKTCWTEQGLYGEKNLLIHRV